MPTGKLPELVAPRDSSSTERLDKLHQRGTMRKGIFGCTAAVMVLLFAIWVSNSGGSSTPTTTYPGSAAGTGYYGGGSTYNTYTYPTTRDSSTTRTTTSSANSMLTSDDAASQLAAIAAADRPELLSWAEGHWVPQLSSKKPGLVVNGRTYDHAEILADHTQLRSAYPGTKLAWSADWSSFKYQNYWVTIAGERFSTSQAANAWCDRQGFGKDDCYAKRLSTTGGYDGNTKPR